MHLKHKALWIAVGAMATAVCAVGLVVFAYAQTNPELAKQIAEAVSAALKVQSPPTDWPAIALTITAVAGLLTTIGTITLSFVTYYGNKNLGGKVEELKVNTDGKLAELVEAQKGKNVAEGKLAGIKEEKAEEADRKVANAIANPLGPIDVQIVSGPGKDAPMPVVLKDEDKPK